jgi:hypothetical protein
VTRCGASSDDGPAVPAVPGVAGGVTAELMRVP